MSGPTNEIPTGSEKSPFKTIEVRNSSITCVQYWVDKNDVVKLLSVDIYRRGLVIKNNGDAKIYIGNTTDLALLQKIGMVIEPKDSFSSALFQGEIYCIADALSVNTQDVRIWYENL